ncbi:MAG: hypothetical protein E7G07_04660 [Flavonifractor plautii]|nr:hypothetical protein [Flavonifractor plautii]
MKERIERAARSVKARARAAWAFVRAHPAKTTVLVLAPLAGVALSIKLIALIVGLMNATAQAVAAFLDRYLIGIGIAAAAVWWLLDQRSKRKAAREEQKRLEQERERARWVRDYEATKDATYTKEGKMVLGVVKEMGSMGIVPPRRLSDIYSPGRTIPIGGGKAMLCQYLIEKARGIEVDEEQFASVLQTKIDQRLAADEWPDVKAQHVYDGRVYSGFTVHKVRDSSDGGYLEVYTALVNDAYCRYLLDQEMGKDAPPPSADRRDIDY